MTQTKRQEEIEYLRAVTRGFRLNQEYERLIQVRQEAPEVFAQIPQHHQDKILPYVETKRDWERLQKLEAQEREEVMAQW